MTLRPNSSIHSQQGDEQRQAGGASPHEIDAGRGSPGAAQELKRSFGSPDDDHDHEDHEHEQAQALATCLSISNRKPR